MAEEVWNNYISGTKIAYEARIKAEKEAEEARIEAERKSKLESERRYKTSRLADFIDNYDNLIFADMSDDDFDKLVKDAIDKRTKHEQEQERIRLENEKLKKEAEEKEKARIAAEKKAEAEREKECAKYSPENLEKKCVKLIGWGEYCEDVKYRYVPKYCYADSTIWEYVESRSWNYINSFIKRALWIGNNTYSLSDDMIRSSNIDTGIKTGSVNIGK